MDKLYETDLAIHDCELDIEDLIVLEKALSQLRRIIRRRSLQEEPEFQSDTFVVYVL